MGSRSSARGTIICGELRNVVKSLTVASDPGDVELAQLDLRKPWQMSQASLEPSVAGTSVGVRRRPLGAIVELMSVVFSRRLWLGLGVVLVVGLTVGFAGGSPSNAAAISSVSQCSNAGTVGGATITCAVTVTNNFAYNAATPSQPTGSATIVTTISCPAAANCPVGGTITSTAPVTSITQCDSSGLGSASTVNCTATVTNNLTGYPTGSAIVAGISQCQSPGTVATETCTATPAGNSQTGSGGPGGQSVSQCNASGGAGGTLTCTVTAPASQSTGLPTTITQCNGSGSTGASTVTCTATITNNFLASTTGGTTTTTGATTTTVPSSTTTTAPATTTSSLGSAATGGAPGSGSSGAPGSASGGPGASGQSGAAAANAATLPQTGMDVLPLIAAGLVSIGVGGFLTAVTRRKRPAHRLSR